MHGAGTRQDHRHTPALDLVNRQFTAAGPNRLWVADATRIPCGEGVFWLAAVRDVFSRRIVGWKTSDRCDTDLILAALITWHTRQIDHTETDIVTPCLDRRQINRSIKAGIAQYAVQGSSGDNDGMDSEAGQPTPKSVWAAARQTELFEALARTAESIGRTAERGAAVHDQIAEHLPGAAEHAVRERRFAEAERAAAAAYRRREVPSEDILRMIRDSRADRDAE